MEWREGIDSNGMLTRYRQLTVSVVQETSTQPPRVYGDDISTDSTLDHNLPHARCAEKQLILRVIN